MTDKRVVVEVVDSADRETVGVHQTADGVYHVTERGVVRHSPCTAEDAMRALAHYLQSSMWELDRLKYPE